ncbi:MAG: hypothetical protein ABFS56_22870 [Pseudomonadota bacterium]
MLFSGNQTLFQGLYIYDKIEWQPHPVILIDFNCISYSDDWLPPPNPSRGNPLWLPLFSKLSPHKLTQIITEYIEGIIDAETWLNKKGKLSLNEGIKVGLQIAKGLDLAHQKGILHLT